MYDNDSSSPSDYKFSEVTTSLAPGFETFTSNEFQFHVHGETLSHNNDIIILEDQSPYDLNYPNIHSSCY